MKTQRKPPLTARKWFYPLLFFGLIILSMLPLITQQPYDPRQTQTIIGSVLMLTSQPYLAWGWVFHVAFLGVAALIAIGHQHAGRVLAAYIGLNYLIIAYVQSHAVVEPYGLVIIPGSLALTALLGITWLVVAARGEVSASFKGIPAWRYLLLPLALLAFWLPFRSEANAVVPDFNPLLLLTSADFGLAYCFATPVFMFLLILFYPNVNAFAFRLSAFVGLIYGLFNLTHWFHPGMAWMGALHLPLLIISLVALALPACERRTAKLISPYTITG
jgi:hypothetical protein